MVDRSKLYKTVYTQGEDKPRRLHDSWHRGSNTNFIPSKANLAEPDALAKYVFAGWCPPKPVIGCHDQILAVGSCFAMHIATALRELRANVTVNQGKTLGAGTTSDINLFTFGAGFVNTFSVLQQFEWALGRREVDATNLYVQMPQTDPSQPRVIGLMPLTPEIREQSRSAILASDAFIVTLGLSEVWYDKLTGEVFFGAVPESAYNPERHAFRVMTVDENKVNLAALVALLREYKPSAPIVFTLSPVPLMATFRPVSCLTANSASKAILRAAVDEFIREERPGVYYWPSYEVITDFFGPASFKEDRRHVTAQAVKQIMSHFAAAFIAEN